MFIHLKSIPSFLSFFFIILIIYGCYQKENDFTKFELSWHFVRNELQGDKPVGVARMIFRNQGKNDIKAGSWHIDFNQITFFEKSKGDTTIGEINHVNGYLNRFTPGNSFVIKAGDSLVYEYISNEPFIKAGYAPRGAYVVDGDKITELPEIRVSGFENLNNVFPDPAILATVPTAENTFDYNQLIQSYKSVDLRSKIIPGPEFSKKLPDSFILTSDVAIVTDLSTIGEAEFLGDFLRNNFGFALQNMTKEKDTGINDKKKDKTFDQ